jgi:hypothetical protein
MSRRKVMNLALRNPKGSPTPTVSEFVVALERLSSADLARVVRFLRLLKSASQSSKATVAAMMKSPAPRSPQEVRTCLEKIIAALETAARH